MTLEEAIEKMKTSYSGDSESCHYVSDEVLLQYLHDNGAQDLVAAWENNNRDCGGFWYA